MTNEDYVRWLMGMIEHNRQKALAAEGGVRIEYWASMNAYQKALTVFRKDVMEEEE